MSLQNDLNSKINPAQEQTQECKIELIKRRLALFKDKNKASKEYFKKLITS